MNVSVFYLIFDAIKNISPHKIRGYFGRRYDDYILLHHHLKDNKILYRYPLVQYKKIQDKYYIIGLNEGADILKSIWLDTNNIVIDGQIILLNEKEIIYKNFEIKTIDNMRNYKFETPWLALNQENHENYKLMLFDERKQKLKSILISNIISFCKAVNYTVTEQIRCEVNISTTQAQLKGIEMTAFTGEFRVNFALPDFIGLGKSVARGFGVINKK